MFIRKTEKPSAVEDLTGAIARAPFVAGEPLRESKLIKANGSGYMAAVLDKGSPLTGCVSTAVDSLRADGTLASIEQEWLASAGNAPELQ